MPNYVPGIGPSSAKIAIVGEAPGKEEDEKQQPFVGPTGQLLMSVLNEYGVKREEVYLTNVVKHRPENNDLANLKNIGKTVQDYLPQLFEELRSLRPNIILALGRTALEALTSHKGIESYRGSVLPTNYGAKKLIPLIHPAAILRTNDWGALQIFKWDIARAIEQSKFPEYEPPRRNLIVAKNSNDVYRFFNRFSNNPFVSVDIETFRTFPICIGFAFNKTEAISIPLFRTLSEDSQGMTHSDQVQCWKDVAEILANPRIKKIGQNFKFDELQLDRCYNGTVDFGLKVRGFFYDTKLAFRTLYPELKANLALIASVLTEEPYWKDEGKEYNPKKDKLDRLLLYNAKDAAVTYECFEKSLLELQGRELDNFFFERVMPLHSFYRRIESRGILRDSFQQKYLFEKYNDKYAEKQSELEDLVGHAINVASPKQVGILVYEELNLPQRKGTGEEELDGLIRNVVKDERKKRILELILETRKVRKTIGTYIEAEASPDGRIRTNVNIMLETGRSATSILKPPVTTRPMGLAFQTITKHGSVGEDLRVMFRPDPGMVFLEPDLSGAEARVVAVLSGDEKLLKLFDFNADIHRITYAWIEDYQIDTYLDEFYKTEDKLECFRIIKELNNFLKSKIDSEVRQIGKVARHSGNLGVGKKQASISARISEARAGKLLEKFHRTNSGVKGVFHKGIVDCLRNNDRTLVNPFGRVRQFFGKWGEDLFREAYAQIPQSTVSDQTKFAGQRIERRMPEIQILLESHDSLFTLCPINKVDQAIRIFAEELETPIDFSNCSLGKGSLIIPCEVMIGKENWKEMEKIYG